MLWVVGCCFFGSYFISPPFFFLTAGGVIVCFLFFGGWVVRLERCIFFNVLFWITNIWFFF